MNNKKKKDDSPGRFSFCRKKQNLLNILKVYRITDEISQPEKKASQ